MNKPGFKRLEAILWKKYNNKKSEALVDIKTSVRINNKSDMNLIKDK